MCSLKFYSIGNGIMNTRIPVVPNVAVSLSYSLLSSSWQSIGTKEQPQGAILFYGLVGIEDLYYFDNCNNIKQCDTEEDINNLINIASDLKPTHCIYVFDLAEGCSVEEWHPRFIVDNTTKDFSYKLEYLESIYLPTEVKIEPL